MVKMATLSQFFSLLLLISLRRAFISSAVILTNAYFTHLDSYKNTNKTSSRVDKPEVCVLVFSEFHDSRGDICKNDYFTVYFLSNVRLRQVLEMVTGEKCPLTHQMKSLKGQLCSKRWRWFWFLFWCGRWYSHMILKVRLYLPTA